MQIAARTGAWSGNLLPYDRKVKYLWFPTGSSILTGLIGKKSYEFEIDFVPLSFGPWGVIFGFYANDDFRKMIQFGKANGRTGFSPRFCSTTNALSFGEIVYGERFACVLKFGYLSINDVEEYVYETSGYDVLKEEIQLGSLIAGSNLEWRNSSSKIFSWKADDENRNVRDFIPVVKDGVGYMFDKAGSICQTTGTSLYPNSGIGKFGWEEMDGTVVEPETT